MGRLLEQRAWGWVACACLVAIVGMSWWAWLATGHESLYPLDDTFIHLAIAKNLARGHWGVTAGEISNASSSPIYVALLALLGKLGMPWLWIPIVVNSVAAVLLLGVANSILERNGVRYKTLALGALLIFLPLPYIAQFGMEHTLHTAIALLFASAVICTLNGASPAMMIALGPLLLGLRLESAFLIGLAGLCLLRLGRYRDAALLGVISGLPVLALGLFNLSLGEHFLPNPILLKAGIPGGGALWLMPLVVLQKAVIQGLSAPHFVAILIVLVAAADAALKQYRDWRHPRVLWPLGAALAIAGHLAFANVGWLYRYEVYLVALALVGFAIAAPKPRVWMLALLILPLGYRGWQCAMLLPNAILDLNAQQVQMAHFVEQNLGDADVAAHDIGALAFYSRGGVLDLAGLASRPILERRLSGLFDTADIDRLSRKRGTRLAIVYDSWFQGNGSPRQFWIGPKLPEAWVKIGEWRLRNPVSIGDDTLSFYATGSEDAPRLAGLLEGYAAHLTSRITYKATPLVLSKSLRSTR